MSMGAQIPVISEKPLVVCVCRKFQVDALGDHLCTCTVHSGVKKDHDWSVDQLADLFRTTHKVKTQQVVKSRGQHCGDIERHSITVGGPCWFPPLVSLPCTAHLLNHHGRTNSLYSGVLNSSSPGLCKVTCKVSRQLKTWIIGRAEESRSTIA